MNLKFYYKRFRRDYSIKDSLELISILVDYKRISGQITDANSKMIQDYLNLKRGLKTRPAYPRNAYNGLGHQITCIKGDLYGLQNGKTYNYNELVFKKKKKRRNYEYTR